jgi:hypothetical protein
MPAKCLFVLGFLAELSFTTFNLPEEEKKSCLMFCRRQSINEWNGKNENFRSEKLLWENLRFLCDSVLLHLNTTEIEIAAISVNE